MTNADIKEVKDLLLGLDKKIDAIDKKVDSLDTRLWAFEGIVLTAALGGWWKLLG